MIAQLPGRKKTVMSASPGLDGAFDWHSFDLRQTVQDTKAGNNHSETPFRKSLLPSNVSFRGMPEARWWQFEDGTTNFGEIQLDKRDLARLILMDFMFVHSNNWFVIPIDLAIGSLFSVDSLVLYDVFGGTTLVERANTKSSTPDNTWTMFSTGLEDQPTCFADFFLLPPSASMAIQTGETIEEVNFMRDETANMVWAIEHTTEDSIGQPWSGHERAMKALDVHTIQSTKTDETTQQTSYKIQSNIPENWIPFLPVVIRKRKSGKQIVLERSTILVDAQGSGTKYVEPKGRILQPQANPYHLREEEVPRTGLRVLRSHYRTRWIDGSTHVWIGRRKIPGMGESSSGLHFDALVPKHTTKK